MRARVEVFIVMNEEGKSSVAGDLETALEELSQFEEGNNIHRVIRKLFWIMPPRCETLPDEVVPDDEGETKVTT
jgi:hypothetical protein